MNRTFDRIIDIAAYVVGTAWDLADQAQEYIPAILQMLASLASTWQALGKHLANLANRAVYLATALASCVALAYTALKPLCVAQARAGARVLRQGGTLVRLNAPLVLNRLYEALRAIPEKGMAVSKLVSKSMSKLGASWKAAWQFRKECLA